MNKPFKYASEKLPPSYKPVFHKPLIDEPYSPVTKDGKPRKQGQMFPVLKSMEEYLYSLPNGYHYKLKSAPVF